MLYEILWEAYDPTAPKLLAGLFAFEYAFNKLVMSGDIAAPALPLNVVVTQSPKVTRSKLIKQNNAWVLYINPSQRESSWSYGYHDLIHLLTTSMITHVGKKQHPNKPFEEKPDKLIVKLSQVYQDILEIVKETETHDVFNTVLKRFGYKNIKQVPLILLENFLRLLSQDLFSAGKSYAAGAIHKLKNDVLDIRQERDSNDDQRAGTVKYTRVHYGVSDKNKKIERLSDPLGGQPQYYVEETIGNYLQQVIEIPVQNSQPIDFSKGEGITKFLGYLEAEAPEMKSLFDSYGGNEIFQYILGLMPKLEQLYNGKLSQITNSFHNIQ